MTDSPAALDLRGLIGILEASIGNPRAGLPEELFLACVEFERRPLAVNEIRSAVRDTRGHFISLLHECRLLGSPDPGRQSRGGTPAHGQWAWHAGCPENLISQHEIYRTQINAPTHSESSAR